MARTAIHPGEQVQIEMDELHLTAEAFAAQIGVPVASLEALLHGKANLSADMALRLSHFFGTSAGLWLGFQNLYDLRIAEQANGAAISTLPTVKELIAA